MNNIGTKYSNFLNTHARGIPIQKGRNVRCHVDHGSQAPIVLTTATLPYRWDGDASYHYGNGGELDFTFNKGRDGAFSDLQQILYNYR